jgi:hypothetical protein
MSHMSPLSQRHPSRFRPIEPVAFRQTALRLRPKTPTPILWKRPRLMPALPRCSLPRWHMEEPCGERFDSFRVSVGPGLCVQMDYPAASARPSPISSRYRYVAAPEPQSLAFRSRSGKAPPAHPLLLHQTLAASLKLEKRKFPKS